MGSQSTSKIRVDLTMGEWEVVCDVLHGFRDSGDDATRSVKIRVMNPIIARVRDSLAAASHRAREPRRLTGAAAASVSAKQARDRSPQVGTLPSSQPLPKAVEDECCRVLNEFGGLRTERQTVRCINIVRAKTGKGFGEAKAIIEALISKLEKE